MIKESKQGSMHLSRQIQGTTEITLPVIYLSYLTLHINARSFSGEQLKKVEMVCLLGDELHGPQMPMQCADWRK